jgi:prefoldin subunit 5
MKLSTLVRLGQTEDVDPKIEELREQIENMDRTIEQLRRRQEALTGPEVDRNTAEAIRNSIQRRIDAVNEDKTDLQREIQGLIQKKALQCKRSKK